MRNSNIIVWANNYREYLLKYYDQLTFYFAQHNHPIPEYKTFVIYVYQNTRKRYDNIKRIWVAPVY